MGAIRAGDRVRTPGFLVGGVPGEWIVDEAREDMPLPRALLRRGVRWPFLLCRETVGGNASLWFPLADVESLSRAV